MPTERVITAQYLRQPAIATPSYSVTVVPGGPCYRIALALSRRLAVLSGLPAGPRPHVTIQMIYGPADSKRMYQTLVDVAARVRPFVLNVSGVGVLPSLTEPGKSFINAKLQRTPDLLTLHRLVTQRMQALGLQTFAASGMEWIPHLSIVSGSFSPTVQRLLLEELQRGLDSCTFLVNALHLNRRLPNGQWCTLATVPLLGDLDHIG